MVRKKGGILIMGYSVTIGNAKIFYCEEDSYLNNSVKITVDEITDPSSYPLVFSEGGYVFIQNYICPSYNYWGNFIEKVGLTEYMSKNGKRNGLVNCTLISKKIIKKLKEIKKELEDKGRVPRFGSSVHCEDEFLNYINWMIWWSEWAINNCEYPTIEVA